MKSIISAILLTLIFQLKANRLLTQINPEGATIITPSVLCGISYCINYSDGCSDCSCDANGNPICVGSKCEEGERGTYECTACEAGYTLNPLANQCEEDVITTTQPSVICRVDHCINYSDGCSDCSCDANGHPMCHEGKCIEGEAGTFECTACEAGYTLNPMTSECEEEDSTVTTITPPVLCGISYCINYSDGCSDCSCDANGNPICVESKCEEGERGTYECTACEAGYTLNPLTNQCEEDVITTTEPSVLCRIDHCINYSDGCSDCSCDANGNPSCIEGKCVGVGTFECTACEAGYTLNPLTSQCEEDTPICSIGEPLRDSSGVELYCGVGPAYTPCPNGSECVISPTDQFAVCCQKEVSYTPSPTTPSPTTPSPTTPSPTTPSPTTPSPTTPSPTTPSPTTPSPTTPSPTTPSPTTPSPTTPSPTAPTAPTPSPTTPSPTGPGLMGTSAPSPTAPSAIYECNLAPNSGVCSNMADLQLPISSPYTSCTSNECLYVSTTSDCYAECSMNNPYKTIQAAIDENDGYKTIILSSGTYTGSGNYNINKFGATIKIYSSSGPDNTIIDCQGNGYGFYFYSATVEMKGLTVRNCVAPQRVLPYVYPAFSGRFGGAFYLYQLTATFTDMIIRENDAEYGGAIFSYQATIIFRNSNMYRNCASKRGGGIYLFYGSASIENTILSCNDAEDAAGGIYNEYASTNIILQSEISYNDATSVGNEYFCKQSSVNIDSGNGAKIFDNNINSWNNNEITYCEECGIYGHIGNFCVSTGAYSLNPWIIGIIICCLFIFGLICIMKLKNNKKTHYDQVKYVDSEQYDDSEINAINISN